MTKTTRVLAVSSSGGHWEQLMLVRGGFAECEIHYATTMAGLAERSGVDFAHLLSDFNARKPLKALRGLFQVARLVISVRPDVVVSTGAAPGIFALLIGRSIGARTIWIDSIANVEQLSLSGRIAGHIAHLWLTQWAHLATARGPRYYGAVL